MVRIPIDIQKDLEPKKKKFKPTCNDTKVKPRFFTITFFSAKIRKKAQTRKKKEVKNPLSNQPNGREQISKQTSLTLG